MVSSDQPLLPEELEYLAEDELVVIKPKFKLDELKLIRGVYGPFRAGLQTEVPLWLATQLRRHKKCEIIAPAWMDPDSLQTLIDAEKDNTNDWQPIPRHMFEMGFVMLKHAAADIPNVTQVRMKLQALHEARISKINYHLNHLDPSAYTAIVTHLTPFEVSLVKAPLSQAMVMFHAMDNPDAAPE